MEESLDQFILANFDTALSAGHIQVYYQPVIRTISGQLCSFEALARWIDPDRGMLPPDAFIPVLEQAKRIHRLDSFVIETVCRRIRQSVENNQTPIPVSINLSRMDFTHCDIFSVVDENARAFHILHDFLYIEITESVLAEQEGQMRDVVERFRKAGYQIWMDDFGSGYSSLNMLKDYSFDELKLDMRFLSSFSQRSRRILTSVVQMAKEIGMHTLAEGVETEEQFSYLRNIGCEKVQGFYFGRPMPYEAALDALREKGITVELPRHRKYYDDIGRVDFLSAVPFLGQSEKKRLVTGRQLNSIPLALTELRRDSFSVLFCNSAYEEVVSGIDFLPESLRSWRPAESLPLSAIPARVLSLLENTRAEGSGRMLFVSNEEYYELKTKCIAKRRDAYSVLLQLNNLSQASQATSTTRLDDSLRQIYTLFDRVTLVDMNSDSITPLYVGLTDFLTDGSGGIRELARDFAERWIYPEDRESYLKLWDFSTLEQRLDASGRTELLENIFGAATRKSGKLFKNGQEIYNRTPKEAIRNGFALVTEERRATGIFGILNIRENTVIASLKKYLKFIFLQDKQMAKGTDDMIRAMSIKTPSQKTQIRSLSGGNQQKVIFGRWILTNPDILLLDEPTRGIDVGAKYEIYQLIQNLAKEGKSVIMVSSEMPELLGVCSRILVMSGGRLAGEVDADNTSQEEIMTLAAKYV